MGLLIDGKNDIIKKPLYQEITTADGYSISLSKNTYSTIYASPDLNVWSLKYYYNAGGSAYHVTLSSSQLSTSVLYGVGGTIHWEAEIEERESGNDYLLKIKYFGIDAPSNIIGYKYELVIGSEQISDITIEGDTTINGTLNATGNVSIGTMTDGGVVSIGEITGGNLYVGTQKGSGDTGLIEINKVESGNIAIDTVTAGLIHVTNMEETFTTKFENGLSDSTTTTVELSSQSLYIIEIAHWNNTNTPLRYLFYKNSYSPLQPGGAGIPNGTCIPLTNGTYQLRYWCSGDTCYFTCYTTNMSAPQGMSYFKIAKLPIRISI